MSFRRTLLRRVGTLGRSVAEVTNGNRLWHYTAYDRLGSILVDDHIRTASLYTEPGERKAAWVSTNPKWEETANKALRGRDGKQTEPLSKDELFRAGIIPMRIEINPKAVRFFDWDGFVKKSGISEHHAEGLEASGRRMGGNPSEWYASFAPIRVAAFLEIEIWNGKKWLSTRSHEAQTFLYSLAA
ncbi:hypothetical protein SBDP1_340006 [Syntrophobacter sp. SbD1]|nr:hypothetical protein SBDP1_340006 [Syntrophobacter sp. SbD1]